MAHARIGMPQKRAWATPAYLDTTFRFITLHQNTNAMLGPIVANAAEQVLRI